MQHTFHQAECNFHDTLRDTPVKAVIEVTSHAKTLHILLYNQRLTTQQGKFYFMVYITVV